MSVTEREEYVAAVTCLMKLPSKVSKEKFSGARSRFDDFVAYHMTHAAMLHDTIHLFAAHKYYVWVYEKALREECGYKGYQPVCTVTHPRFGVQGLTERSVHELRPVL